MAAVDDNVRGAPARGRAAGFSDWLPGAAARRRDLADAFVSTFEAWGYSLLGTPLIEPLDTIAAGVGAARQSRLFRFMDADGDLLALVGERTVSVARVVATQLQREPLPLRLCYAGPVLHHGALLNGRRRESMQAGCELVGHPGLAADAECIALASSALVNGGVADVQIDVGHADFIPAVLDSAGLDPAARREVLSALARRDLVAVESALEQTDVGEAERRLLLAFPTLRGGRDLLDTAAVDLRGGRPHAVLAQLAELWTLLEAHEVTAMVHLDLGAVRDWDYYTGPTFEVFSLDSGFPLGSGGRYDRLLERFGPPQPATGFVLHVDRCHDALERRADGEHVAPRAVRVGWDAARQKDALRLAADLRRRGFAAACSLSAEDRDADAVVTDSGVTWVEQPSAIAAAAMAALQASGPTAS
ncbi:MAG: ATP phosphoribosyltransferase regulatory subunit [Candidatus Dormibacteraeota bacterium]|nr:ATP phosphoribosyltransferase regulatory subunit [Candidatus Dormibacteraeota bacterium]